MTPQDIAHGDLVNVIADIRQSPLYATVTLGRIVVGHLQDERFDLIRGTGTS
jgi:hypothetical protein